ncbi:MAG: hypothetical protein QF464_12020, partial [Myxococcota bacterium]|nr:hypothetical protein [Myxococcota bacterium]
MTLLSMVICALAASSATAATPVLPISATAPIRGVLSTHRTMLDGRLMLQRADLNKDTLTVHYIAKTGEAPALTVVLVHPTVAPEGVRAGPFVVQSHQGEDKAALAALVTRLGALRSDQVWRMIQADTDEAPTEAPEATSVAMETNERVARLLWKVDHALVLGEEAAGKAQLDALSGQDALPPHVLLDLAVRYRRLQDPDRAAALLARYEAASAGHPRSPLEAAEATVLAGGAISASDVIESADACGLQTLAETMDAVGRRDDAYALLRLAAEKTDCPDIEPTLLEWLIADKRVEEADALSA